MLACMTFVWAALFSLVDFPHADLIDEGRISIAVGFHALGCEVLP